MFDIREYLDVLVNNPKDKLKWFCPACNGHNLSINMETGAYNCWNDTTSEHHSLIRENLSPARPVKYISPEGNREWFYQGNSGRIASTVKRYDNGKGDKQVRRIVNDPDEVILPLYWHEAIGTYSQDGGYIFLVEGEPTCDAMRGIGLNAICLIGGSGGYKKELYFDLLSQITDLVLCPDMDVPGMKLMNTISKDFPSALWCYSNGPNYFFWGQDRLPMSGGCDLGDAIGNGVGTQKIFSWIVPKQAFSLSENGIETDIEVNQMLQELRNVYENAVDLTVREVKVAQYLKRSGLRDLGWSVSRATRYCVTEQLNRGNLEVIDSHQLMNLKTKRPRWLIPGLLPSGSTVLLGAYGGVGKTTLCYQLAKHVATGQKFSDYPTNQGRVLIVSADESTHDTKEKLQTIDYSDVPRGFVNFIRFWRFTQIDLLTEAIKNYEPTLVIIDSLTSTTAGLSADRTSSSAGDCIYELRDIAERFECTFLILHHLSKVGEFRDSSTYTDNVSEAWKLTRDQNASDYILDFTQKSRSGLQGKLVLRRSIEGYRWNIIGRVGVNYSYDTERRLLAWINDKLTVDGIENWLTADSIAARMESISPSEVHSILPVLRLTGLINCDSSSVNGKILRRYAAFNARPFANVKTNVVPLMQDNEDGVDNLIVNVMQLYALGDATEAQNYIQEYPFKAGERERFNEKLDLEIVSWLAVG